MKRNTDTVSVEPELFTETTIPLNKLLRRAELAEALSAHGFPVAATSLATLASRGGGPKFHKFGATPIYRWADALQWAEARLGPALSSSSEIRK